MKSEQQRQLGELKKYLPRLLKQLALKYGLRKIDQ